MIFEIDFADLPYPSVCSRAQWQLSLLCILFAGALLRYLSRRIGFTKDCQFDRWYDKRFAKAAHGDFAAVTF